MIIFQPEGHPAGDRKRVSRLSRLINIGFGNVVNSEKIGAVVSPEAAPIKRMVQKAKEENELVDATVGRRTKAVIFTSENLVVLSALQPETISRRFNARGAIISEEQGDAEDE
mgnify:FL=1